MIPNYKEWARQKRDEVQVMTSNYDEDHIKALNDGVRSSYDTMIRSNQDLRLTLQSRFDTLDSENARLRDSIVLLTRQQQNMVSQHNAIVNQMATQCSALAQNR
jgi:hypothetical protein